MKELKRKLIGNRKFYKKLMAVTFPIMVQNGMTNFVSLLDNIMVGQLGTEQMSGVAIVNQLIFIYYLLLFGGLSGVGIYTAQYFGNKDDEGIRQTIRFKMWLGMAILIIFSFVMVKFGPDLIGLYLKSESDTGDLAATLNYGLDYLGIVIFMLPAIYIGTIFSSTLRECGQTFTPMIAGVAAVLTNLILDYIFIFGKLGLPPMGVWGAALATVIAKYIEMSIIIVWSIKHRNTHTYLRGIFRTILIPKDIVIKYLITALPLMLNEGLWSIGIAMLNQAYSTRGLDVVAGQNIANTITNIFNIVFIAMGDAVAIIIGQNLGAGDMDKAKDEDRKIIAFAIFTSILIGLLMIATSGLFPQLYKTSQASHIIATQFLIISAIAMPKDAFLHTSYFTIRAGGNTLITFVFDSVFMMAVSVPLANLLVHLTGFSAPLIFALIHSADLIKCIIGFILIKKEVWLKNIVKE
ncbi:MAG: MATE family efflux transporter [Eubacterium sp.]|nr:MATE family efflux transporter [Eubacterium sp.]